MQSVTGVQLMGSIYNRNTLYVKHNIRTAIRRRNNNKTQQFIRNFNSYTNTIIYPFAR